MKENDFCYWGVMKWKQFGLYFTCSYGDDDGGEVKGGEIPRFEIEATHEAKLNEILHKINSIEIMF